jgi:hypothetical protein
MNRNPPQPGQTAGAASPGTSPGSGPGPSPGTGWRGAGREIVVAVLLVIALSAAAWVLEGPAAAGFAAVASAALSLVALRGLIERHEPATVPQWSHESGPSRSFFGFWRTRSDLIDASRSLIAWDTGLRPRLLNLFAARLSERHGISLAADPDAARRVLTAGASGRHDLWTWIDPQRQTPPHAGSLPGIPPAVLAALIDRLERL